MISRMQNGTSEVDGDGGNSGSRSTSTPDGNDSTAPRSYSHDLHPTPPFPRPGVGYSPTVLHLSRFSLQGQTHNSFLGSAISIRNVEVPSDSNALRLAFDSDQSSNSSSLGEVAPDAGKPTPFRTSLSKPKPRPKSAYWGAMPRRERVLSTYTSSDHDADNSNDNLKTNFRQRAKSTALFDGSVDKPWSPSNKSCIYSRISYWITIGCILISIGLSVFQCILGVKSVPELGNLCLVMEDNFDVLDTEGMWEYDVELGGSGNGDFEMTTTSPNNTFVQDGVLYIVPTLTSDVIGTSAIFDGRTYNLTDCTASNYTSCGVVSNSTTRTVINPVQSARLTTKRSASIRYGKVEVRARMPVGDWIWPAIWMLPVDPVYGEWPMSGEINILESRGNGRTYPVKGNNWVHSSPNWGPIPFLDETGRTFGSWFLPRKTFADGFHVFGLEWTKDFLYVTMDSRLQRILSLKFDEPFFARGHFPETVINGTQPIELKNPWAGRPNSAPFDQPFYLIMDVAVGGTNGWFPDGQGGKPWLDDSPLAMYDFAKNQDTWYKTWPEDVKKRGLAMDYVKMWQTC